MSFARMSAVVAGMDGKPGHAMGEAVVGETRSSNGGRWDRPACLSHVGIMLCGDGGLSSELLVGMVESHQEIGPSVVLWVSHAPLTNGFRVGPHGF